jgi:hypothetical protein
MSNYAGQVKKEEQSFQRVADLVLFSKRQQRTKGTFTFDQSVIEVRGSLLAQMLPLKCDIVILSDFVELRKGAIGTKTEIDIDLSGHMTACENLIELAHSTKYVRQEIEGHVYYARLCSFAQAFFPDNPAAASSPGTSPTKGRSRRELKELGHNHVALARDLLSQYASTQVLAPEVDAAETALNDGPFYQALTTEEMRAVYQAMVGEFFWYWPLVYL